MSRLGYGSRASVFRVRAVFCPKHPKAFLSLPGDAIRLITHPTMTGANPFMDQHGDRNDRLDAMPMMAFAHPLSVLGSGFRLRKSPTSWIPTTKPCQGPNPDDADLPQKEPHMIPKQNETITSFHQRTSRGA